jgi:hypothetical protein
MTLGGHIAGLVNKKENHDNKGVYTRTLYNSSLSGVWTLLMLLSRGIAILKIVLLRIITYIRLVLCSLHCISGQVPFVMF